MSKILAIYGASGLGREVLELAKIINKRYNKWNNIIFIDDNENLNVVNDVKVYTYLNAKQNFAEDLEVVIAIGEPAIREKLFIKLMNDKTQMTTLIHPDIHIPQTTSIGNGSVINVGSFISCNITIQENVYVQPNANIGHDCSIGQGSIVSGMVNISGNCHIGEGTYIGSSACIKEGTIIGSHTIIGMMSAVYKDVPSDVIALGNPARVMKNNEDKRVFR